MVYSISAPHYPDPRITVQFYDTLLPGEQKDDAMKRITFILAKINGTIHKTKIVLHQTPETSNKCLVIVPFQHVKDIDETGDNKNSIFTQILHGSGYAKFHWTYNNDCEGWWEMWGYNQNVWQMPLEKNYTPFITAEDFRVFEENGNNLRLCIETFKKEVPIFLRSLDEKEEDIETIMYSRCPIEAFNRMINYPSYEGAQIIDNLFEPGSIDSPVYKLLSVDSYTIFGYFYHVVPI